MKLFYYLVTFFLNHCVAAHLESGIQESPFSFDHLLCYIFYMGISEFLEHLSHLHTPRFFHFCIYFLISIIFLFRSTFV